MTVWNPQEHCWPAEAGQTTYVRRSVAAKWAEVSLRLLLRPGSSGCGIKILHHGLRVRPR